MEEELLILSRRRLANFKSLEAVKFVERDFFPKNALGKAMRTSLRSVEAKVM